MHSHVCIKNREWQKNFVIWLKFLWCYPIQLKQIIFYILLEKSIFCGVLRMFILQVYRTPHKCTFVCHIFHLLKFILVWTECFVKRNMGLISVTSLLEIICELFLYISLNIQKYRYLNQMLKDNRCAMICTFFNSVKFSLQICQ